jgi:aminoglycoside phosphotransferase (APT) family kinase protein
VEHEGEVALEWSDLIGTRHPDVRHRAERLAVGWLDAARQHPVDRHVPLHKDFHAGHVLVGDAVCVIDLDEARLGDPAFDVAHFLTYLEATPGRCDSERLRDAFLEAYIEESGWTDQGSLAPYCAYTWLKIAKQRALRTGPLPVVPGADRHSLVEAAIGKGERCLEQ